MHLIGLARLGADVTLRYLPDGKAVVNLGLAFNYGKKDQDGKRLTQWIDGVLTGERAAKLAPFLLKGTRLHVHLAEPHIETYTDRNGATIPKMTAFVSHLDFAGDPPQQQAQQTRQPAPAPAPNRAPPAAQNRGASGFDDLDDMGPPF